MEWSLSIGESWWYVAVCVFVALGFTALLYLRSKDLELFRGWAYLTAALRFVLVFTLAFMLLRPLFSAVGYRTEKPRVHIAIDNSVSAKLSGFDPQFIQDSLRPLMEDLADRYALEYYTYGSKVERLHKVPSLDEPKTDLSEVLRYLDKKASEENTAAVVLLTDGIYTSGSDPMHLARESRVPIYTLAYGDTTVKRDASIAQVHVNSIAYLGNRFEMQVDVELNKLQGVAMKLELFKGGQRIDSRTIDTEKQSSFHEVTFVLEANEVGPNAYILRLSGADGEENTANNKAYFVVDVLDSKKKIGIWTNVTHPDVGAMGRWLGSNENYDVALQTLRKPDGQDLVILYDWFSNDKELREYEALRTANIPVLIIFGEHSQSALFNKGSQGLSFEQLGRQGNDALPVSNVQFDHFDIAPELAEDIGSWSPLRVKFGEFSGFAPKDVLLYQVIGGVETSHPLLLFKNENNYRYGVLAGSGYWHWRMLDFQRHAEHYLSNGLWSNTVQFLTVKENIKRFDVDVARSSLPFGQTQSFKAELFNQSMKAVQGAEIVLSVVDEDNSELKRVMQSNGSGYQLRLDGLAAGLYRYSASVEQGGENLQDQGYFTVVEDELEAFDLQADHKLLRAISAVSGGFCYQASDLQSLIGSLEKQEGAPAVIKEEKQWFEMIDIKGIFWILVALVSLEWLVRKLNGGY